MLSAGFISIIWTEGEREDAGCLVTTGKLDKVFFKLINLFLHLNYLL